MNWIAGLTIGICLAVCGACGVPAAEGETADKRYEVHYEIRIQPEKVAATVTVEVRQSNNQLREMAFAIDSRFNAIDGSGRLLVTDREVTWQPGPKGGELRMQVAVPNLRSESTYDAWLEDDWGLFRAEDLIPRARTRTVKGASSDTTLSFDLPERWSVVTEYSALSNPMRVTRPGRRFSQPTGWIAAGELGVRREMIAGTRVAVAGPQGHAVRRMDMLALLNWTLPELEALLGETPERLTIVSAGDPMWRGGLSAPASLYIHADRPLISENATSTLLHETMHVALALNTADQMDWITEGFAEYYSLELLHRGGAITSRRYQRALEEQAEWATRAGPLCGAASTGATTALAVMVLRRLDEEIREATSGVSSLDNVVSGLRKNESPVSLESLRTAASELTGTSPSSLNSDSLPGCGRS